MTPMDTAQLPGTLQAKEHGGSDAKSLMRTSFCPRLVFLIHGPTTVAFYLIAPVKGRKLCSLVLDGVFLPGVGGKARVTKQRALDKHQQ